MDFIFHKTSFVYFLYLCWVLSTLSNVFHFIYLFFSSIFQVVHATKRSYSPKWKCTLARLTVHGFASAAQNSLGSPISSFFFSSPTPFTFLFIIIIIYYDELFLSFSLSLNFLADFPVTIFIEPRSRNEIACDVGWTRG